MFLTGVKVLEWADGLAAPFASRILSDLGAEVIKVERPGRGDDLRSAEPLVIPSDPVNGSALFGYVNAGKRSVTLDLATEEGAKAFGALAAQSAILIESQSSQSLAESRFTLDALKAANPGLVIISVSALGRIGVSRQPAQSDLTLAHHSGFAYHSARPVRSPAEVPPVAGADREGPLSAGVAAAMAALWGLAKREKGLVGPHVDMSLSEFQTQLLYDALVEWDNGEVVFERAAEIGKSRQQSGGLVWILPCAHGYVLISPREDHQWARWLELMGNPIWGQDAALCGDAPIRRAHWHELQALMSEWTKDRVRDEIFDLAQKAKVPCFPLSMPEDLLRNAQLHDRGFFDSLKIGDRVAAVPGLPFKATLSDGTELPRSRILSVPPLGGGNGVLAALNATPAPMPPLPSPDAAALSGVIVADFSWIVAGPIMTKTLALMGAEVIKIETTLRPEFSKRDGWFSMVNNNKNSCTINITHPEGQALARKIVAKSDVMVENFSASVMRKYKLDYQEMRQVRPELIYCTASGVGRQGPQADVLAYGTLLQAYCGRSALIGDINLDLEAMGILPPWTDPITALWGTTALLAALRQKQQSGRGCYIDLSMLESTAALLPEALMRQSLGMGSGPHGNVEKDAAPSGCFRCAGEDRWLALSVRSDAEWAALCNVMGHGELAGDPRFANRTSRLQAKAELDRAVGDWIAGLAAEEAEAQLQAAGVPAAISRNMNDIMTDPEALGRGAFPRLADGTLAVALPWQDETGWRGTLRPAPALGANNAYVFGELLGMKQAEIARLAEEGAIR